MKTSQTYKCPKCGDPVKIDVQFESDDLGDRIEVEVWCLKCHDSRFEAIDEMRYNFGDLVRKVGM